MQQKTDTEIIYPELGYTLNGIFFKVHNQLGRFATEKQYCDLIDHYLKEAGIPYKREVVIRLPQDSEIKELIKDRVDFIIADKIIVEVKAKKFIGRGEYYQTHRYLTFTNMKLGILVNFHSRYLHPKRILNAEIKVHS